MAKEKEQKKKWKDMTPEEQTEDLDRQIKEAKNRIEKAKEKIKELESKKNEITIERIKKKAEANNQTIDDLM